ncbi:MAG: hypothetical protein QOJ37_1423, partial [Pseudonocardiales bacterium]|nr:hypothetical protein [Pseudonocardiales bacterium]
GLPDRSVDEVHGYLDRLVVKMETMLPGSLGVVPA